MNLYFLQYNNYYNRILRVEGEWLEDYDSYVIGELPNVNFVPNDGISTTHIASWSSDYFPDYMLAVDEADHIVSKWFVIESKRLRSG